MGAVPVDIKFVRAIKGIKNEKIIRKEYVSKLTRATSGKLDVRIVALGDDGKSIIEFFKDGKGEPFIFDAITKRGRNISGIYILDTMESYCEITKGDTIYKVDISMHARE